MFSMKEKNLILALLCLIFLSLRLYQLPLRVNFSMDQGQILLKIWQLWQEKKITLIGLETSIKTASGRGFFQGPWIFWLPLPVLLLSNWHSLSVSYFLILLNLFALIILYRALEKKWGILSAFIAGLFFSLMPVMVYSSQFIWNPNFLPFTSCLLIHFWLKLKKKSSLKDLFLTGLILGF